jgi:flavin-dependent dehydrogenase
MAQAYEVLVTGGGPAALSAALAVARYDCRVALFDAGEAACPGTRSVSTMILLHEILLRNTQYEDSLSRR